MNSDEVGNQHVLIAVLMGVCCSVFLTPIGGALVCLIIYAIGASAKAGALATLAEMRRLDEEERVLLGERMEDD